MANTGIDFFHKAKILQGIRVIIAGGGTGGHLFPGVAVAEEIRSRYGEAKILFITGRRKLESDILKGAEYLQASINIEGLKGKGWKKGIITILRLPMNLLESFAIIKSFSPHLVLGVGGYSSGPVCLAARIRRIPSAIHEQNSFPGFTNRLLSGIVNRVFISFEASRSHFKRGTLVLTGNPIRENIMTGQIHEKRESEAFTILVMGGSQGARAINTAVVDAMEILRDRKRMPRVLHQTGEMDYPRVTDEYHGRRLQAELFPFIQDMATAYREADIVVSRAGATTVAELAALGKPAILVPYPHAANRHQETNARMLVDAGGAEMLLEQDLSGDSLAGILAEYMENRPALREMGERALKVGRTDAAKVIVDHLEELIGAKVPSRHKTH